MRLLDLYDGSDDPFEGERTIIWRSLPANAVVTKATLTLTPILPPGASTYTETLGLGPAGPGFGATIQQAGTGVVEIDFHARRTANSIAGLPAVTTPTLSVDIGGGVFMAVGANGTVPAQPGSNFDFSTGALPGIAALRMRLASWTLPADRSGLSLGIATMASNLTLRFGKRLPFWSKTGELAVPATTPDITDAVQRALADATVSNGFYAIPLVAHSDTLGRLTIALDVTYLGSAPLVPPGLREVVLPYDYAGVTTTAPSALQADIPAGAVVVSPQTALQVRGAFDASRVAYGPTGPTNEATTIRCSATETLAQPLLPASDTNISGVDLFVAAEGPAARLALDLRADFDGKPGATSLLVKPVPFDLTGDAAGQRRWVNVAVAPAALLNGGARTWLVVQALGGAAQVGVDAAADPTRLTQRSTDAGFSWRHAGLAGPLLSRLRTLPDRFHMPIDFVAGAGAQAQRVSLAAYDPLGKIDAVIDRPEIAAAVQAAVTQSVPAPCIAIEIMQNADFSQWVAQGTTLAEDAAIDTGTGGAITLVETFFDQQVETLLAGGGPQALAWSADGLTLFASFRGGVYRIDPRTLATVPVINKLNALALATDPVGGTLYAVDGNALLAIDPEQGTQATVFTTGDAQVLVLSQDGARAYVGGKKFVVAFDLTTGTELFNVLVVASSPTLALAPDGRTLVTADQSTGSVLTFDATSGTPGWTATLPSLTPQAVAVGADGASVYALGVPDAGANALFAFDAGGRMRPSLTLGFQADGATALLVKPQGDRVYLASAAAALDPAGGRLGVGTGSAIAVVTVGARAPVGWTLTAGQVAPLRSPDDPTAIAAVLESGSLSQVRAVSPNCLHDLTVIASVNALRQQSPDGVAEVFWLDAVGTLLRTDSQTLPISTRAVTQQLRLSPPSGSAQAEVRVRVAGGSMLLETVSLKSIDALLQAEAWKPDPTALSRILATADATGTVYRNLGAGDGALVQSVAAPASPLMLDFQGGVVAVGATIEFAYQDANGVPLGPVQSIALDGPAFAGQPALLAEPPTGAPAGATLRARIVLPAGGALRVERLVLQPRPMATVPCGFIAQSPGTLHVANAQIVYDWRPGAPPAPPPGGLANPTPPDMSPGDPSCGCEPAPSAAALGLGAILPKPVAVGASVRTVRASAIPEPALTDVNGIGPGRVRRLTAAGIATVRDLAAATPEQIAAVLAGPAASAELAAGLIEKASEMLSAHAAKVRG